MNAKQGKTIPMPNMIYGPIYDDTRASILASSDMTEARIGDLAIELIVEYQSFRAVYKGPHLVDDHAGLLAMLRQWPAPWPAAINGLGGFAVELFLLAWAWNENRAAKYLLDGEAVASGWNSEDAMECGVMSAVSAAKSLFYAQSLLASGSNAMVPKTLPHAIRPNMDKGQGLRKSQ